jgi:hypothetical protein
MYKLPRKCSKIIIKRLKMYRLKLKLIVPGTLFKTFLKFIGKVRKKYQSSFLIMMKIKAVVVIKLRKVRN